MKKILYIIYIGMLITIPCKAQIPVTDVSNVTQSIINSVQQIIHTSSTATNMLNNFKETIKIYEQGKEYYSALKSVSNLVKDAVKVQKTIQMIGNISDSFVTNYQKMLADNNYTARELEVIAKGYTKLLQEATDLLVELKSIINITGMSMTDKDRIDLIDRVYNRVKHIRDLTNYYTRKNISVSFLRGKAKKDTKRVLELYGTNEKYW